MKKDLKCIMLVDDDENDNFYHIREIKKNNSAIRVIEETKSIDALEYLMANKDNKELLPNLIFLDIHMPNMDGWMFLDSFRELDKELQEQVMVVMLSTSKNPEDIEKSREYSCIAEFISKPLTRQIMERIAKKYFL